MCETDVHGKGRPPPLPRKKGNGPADSAVAFEGTDIQALLDRCDSIQGKWDEDGLGESDRKGPGMICKTSSHGRSKASRSKEDIKEASDSIVPGSRHPVNRSHIGLDSDSIAATATDTGISEVAAGSSLTEDGSPGFADAITAKRTDDDLVVVDLVTEEGREMEEALLELKVALAHAKTIMEEGEDKTVAQCTPGPGTVASPPRPDPEKCSIDAQRQKFQAKLRELTYGMNFEATTSTHELSDRALLDAARQSLLQDNMPGKELVAGSVARSEGCSSDPRSEESKSSRSGITLGRSSGKAQLPRTPSLDSGLRSRPSTSERISRPGTGSCRASVDSLSITSASGMSRPESGQSCGSSKFLGSSSKTPTVDHVADLHRRFGVSNAQARAEKHRQLEKDKRKAQEKEAILKVVKREVDDFKGEELQKKSAQNVAAKRKEDRTAQVIDEEERELQEARRIIQSELAAAQQETSERRVQSEKARQASVVNEVLSSVKDAQRKRHEVSMQKVAKLQQRCETQDWEDCRPQNSTRRDRSRPKGSYANMATHQAPQEAGTMGNHAQECGRSPTGLSKLPRLHASRSAPPEVLKKQVSEGVPLSLPQIPRTRSWLGAAASSQ